MGSVWVDNRTEPRLREHALVAIVHTDYLYRSPAFRSCGVRIWFGKRLQRHYRPANYLHFQIPLSHILDLIMDDRVTKNLPQLSL